MTIRVKDPAQATAKYVQRASAAAQDYVQGITGAGPEWQAQTMASAQTYADAVTEAIGRGAFARGVQSSGGAHYEQKARELGAPRFPQGVRAAQADYTEGVTPFIETIRGLTLPPRRPKGDPANVARVEMINQALRRRKVGG